MRVCRLERRRFDVGGHCGACELVARPTGGEGGSSGRIAVGMKAEEMTNEE